MTAISRSFNRSTVNVILFRKIIESMDFCIDFLIGAILDQIEHDYQKVLNKNDSSFYISC